MAAEKPSEHRRRRTLPPADQPDQSTPPLTTPPCVDDALLRVDDALLRAHNNNNNNAKERGYGGKPKSPCQFDGRSYKPELCSILDPGHILQPEHIEGLIRFLSKTWGFIGARRAIRRYGVEDVNSLAVEIDQARKSTGLGGSDRHIIDPAAFLHHCLTSLEEDRGL